MAERLENIPTVPGMGRSLIEHDPASFNYPARGVLFSETAPLKSKTWRRPGAYNQGRTSTCVAQTFKGVLNTRPHSGLVAAAIRSTYDAADFYRGGQLNDQWPGEEPTYYGTSALGVCKYLADRGIIKEYRWCFGLDDVLMTLSQYGPVGIGVRWTQDMSRPGPRGVITPTGQAIGGHEVELHGIDVARSEVIGTNSWGRGWGDRGRFRLAFTDLQALLADSGDAVTVVRV